MVSDMVLVHLFLQKVKQNTPEIGLKVSDMETDRLNLSQGRSQLFFFIDKICA